MSDAQLIARDHLAKRCASASEAMFTKRKAAKRATELAKRWTPHNDTIQNTTCILDQDVTPSVYSFLMAAFSRVADFVVLWRSGPYQLDGDLIRQNITGEHYIVAFRSALRLTVDEDGEAGIPMILEIGVLDVLSCEPLANAYVDIWHCNSTGYYSKFTGVDPNEDHFCSTWFVHLTVILPILY